MEVTEKVLSALGELHATFYHYFKTYPGGKEQLIKEYPFLETRTFYDLANTKEAENFQDQWFGQIFDNVSTLVKSRGKEGDNELADKVAKFKPEWRARAKGAAYPLKDEFVTINHGDMWYKNLMLRLDF